MRLQPRIPEALQLIADQLDAYAAATDAASQARVLGPAASVLRFVADEFDHVTARRVQEIAEAREMLARCAGEAPSALRDDLQALLDDDPGAYLSRPANELEDLAERLDEALISVQDWLETSPGVESLRDEVRAMQRTRAMRGFPQALLDFDALSDQPHP